MTTHWTLLPVAPAGAFAAAIAAGVRDCGYGTVRYGTVASYRGEAVFELDGQTIRAVGRPSRGSAEILTGRGDIVFYRPATPAEIAERQRHVLITHRSGGRLLWTDCDLDGQRYLCDRDGRRPIGADDSLSKLAADWARSSGLDWGSMVPEIPLHGFAWARYRGGVAIVEEDELQAYAPPGLPEQGWCEDHPWGGHTRGRDALACELRRLARLDGDPIPAEIGNAELMRGREVVDWRLS